MEFSQEIIDPITKVIDKINTEEWSCSSGEASDSEFNFEDFKDEDFSETGSITKLQHRKAVIRACWNNELSMSEVQQHKGGLLVSIGSVRSAKIYLSIEETLFLAEIGALLLVDNEDTTIPLKDIYQKVAKGKGGCSWEHFEVYKYLKSLGYIVGRHAIPWSLKSVRSCSIPLEGTSYKDKTEPTVLDETSIMQLLKDLQIGEVNLGFDVYLPNRKFKKTSPGDPSFTVYLARSYLPSRPDVEELERLCNGTPVKIAHVEHGRVSFFSFEEVELPTLP